MKIDVLGVGVDSLTLEEAAQAAVLLAAGDKFSYAVTPNPEFILLARKSERFRSTLNAADLVVPDGIGVIKAAQILGRPLKAKIPGIELGEALCASMARSGKRLFLLGAKPGVAQKAGERLEKKYPGLVVCGAHDGYFRENDSVVEAIKAAEADVVFVCLGAPKQEFWMAEYGPATGVALMLGLGGSLDVFAGVAERAPEGWRKLGLEWFYRLTREPKRFGRMAKLPLILVYAAIARVGGK